MYRFTCSVAVEKPQREGKRLQRRKKRNSHGFHFCHRASHELIKAQSLVNKYETLPLSDYSSNGGSDSCIIYEGVRYAKGNPTKLSVRL